MSLEIVKIVEEAFANMRAKAQKPLPNDIMLALGSLEATIITKFKESVEIPEQTIQEKYTTLPVEDIPSCQFCPYPAEWEGWANKKDPFTGKKGAVVQRIFVCGEHKDQLKGAQS